MSWIKDAENNGQNAHLSKEKAVRQEVNKDNQMRLEEQRLLILRNEANEILSAFQAVLSPIITDLKSHNYDVEKSQLDVGFRKGSESSVPRDVFLMKYLRVGKISGDYDSWEDAYNASWITESYRISKDGINVVSIKLTPLKNGKAIIEISGCDGIRLEGITVEMLQQRLNEVKVALAGAISEFTEAQAAKQKQKSRWKLWRE